MNKDCNICVLGGGWSNEREISLKSSQDVYKALLENKHNVVLFDIKRDSYHDLKSFLHNHSIDLVFNLVHGEGGEDGKIQSYLDDIGIKYCGSNSHSSYLSFNKFKTKKIWREHNLTTPDFEIYSGQSYQDLTKYYGKNFFIKDKKSLWKNKYLYDLYKEGETPWEWTTKIFKYAKKKKEMTATAPQNVKRLTTQPDAYDPETRFITGYQKRGNRIRVASKKTTDQVNLKAEAAKIKSDLGK